MAKLSGKHYDLEVTRETEVIPDPCIPPCGCEHRVYLVTEPPRYFLQEPGQESHEISHAVWKALAAKMRLRDG